ncbi:TPA: hypothetical protein ACH3X1_001396 [Trebouxia sp. C0004]
MQSTCMHKVVRCHAEDHAAGLAVAVGTLQQRLSDLCSAVTWLPRQMTTSNRLQAQRPFGWMSSRKLLVMSSFCKEVTKLHSQVVTTAAESLNPVSDAAADRWPKIPDRNSTVKLGK